MSAPPEQRNDDAPAVRLLSETGGRVGQLLYPRSLVRHDACFMSRILARVELQCAASARSVSVVVTGGGFLEIRPDRGTPQPVPSALS